MLKQKLERAEQHADANQNKNAKLMSQLKDLEALLEEKDKSIDDLLKKQNDPTAMTAIKKQLD